MNISEPLYLAPENLYRIGNASSPLLTDEKYFNLIWRALHEREQSLISEIEFAGAESDNAALTANDLIYLRLCKKELAETARATGFSESAFSEDDGYLDLTQL
jgi:hypothetical protein